MSPTAVVRAAGGFMVDGPSIDRIDGGDAGKRQRGDQPKHGAGSNEVSGEARNNCRHRVAGMVESLVSADTLWNSLRPTIPKLIAATANGKIASAIPLTVCATAMGQKCGARAITAAA